MASANTFNVDKAVFMAEIFSKDDDEATLTTNESRLAEDESENYIHHDSCLVSPGGSLSKSGRSVVGSLMNSDENNKPSLRPKNLGEEDELNLIRNSGKQKKFSRALASLTINKLNTSNIGLIGREKEIEVLHSCYDRMMEVHDGNRYREIVFIRGWSGVGKSMLAKSLEEKVSSSENGCFAEGKFEFNSSSDEPYSGIAAAFGNLFTIILKDSKRHDVFAIAKDMKNALGEDVKIMTYLIPELGELVGGRSTGGVESNEGAYDAANVQERWKYAFRMMARALTSIFQGLVLFLDDLQWSDVSSLDVIEYLVSDVENPNPLMIVGSYRSNEVDENSVLYKRIQSLLGKHDKFQFKVTEIDVQSLSVDNVNNMIMSILSIDDEETTQDLAEVCFKRTGGNPFFILEFMTLLDEEKLIEFNLGLMKWRWEASKIEEMTMSTNNVVNLLQTRMRKLKIEVQHLLQYAACLGASFSISNLELIWKEDIRKSCELRSDHLTIAEFLDIAKQEKLIESKNESEYRWVHDKVQEAALYLSDSVDGGFRLLVGITLLHGMAPEKVEDSLFDIVDLLNSEKVIKNLEFAELNLRAAEKARNMSALRSASAYASHGIRFLPPAYWDAHRPLALKLYAIAADMELALGKVESSERYVEEVLSQPNMSIMESLPIRLAKARRLCYVQLRHDDSINYCLPLLRELGYNLVWTRKMVPLQAVRSIVRTVKALKQVPKEVLENLSKSEDPKDCTIALILSHIGYAGAGSGDILLTFLCYCRLVEMTLKHGINQFSAAAIAILGSAILIVKQDYETCDKFCELALSLERRFKLTNVSEVMYVAHAYGFCWTRLLGDNLNLAMEGYTLGMQKGTVEFASWNLLQHFLFLPYTMGKALGPMLETFPRVLAQLENVSQSEHVMVLRLFWQMMLNLVGCADQLEGEIFNHAKVNEETPIYRGAVHLCEGELMVFRSDYESASKRAVKYGGLYAKMIPGHFLFMIETFHRGVALYAMAQKKKGLKYRVRAEKVRKTIRKWMKCGNPNVIYFVKFLDAEHYALTSKLDKAEENYQNAIVFTARTGHLHHAGLFNERYSDFLLNKRKDVSEAKFRLGEAIRFFEEWGATGKVQQLKDRVNSLQ